MNREDAFPTYRMRRLKVKKSGTRSSGATSTTWPVKNASFGSWPGLSEKFVRGLATAAVVFCHSSCSTPQMLTEPERAAIQQSAARALPVGTSVQVNDCAGSRGKLDVTVAAHLLEGHSAEENNPYVRGNYHTHEKLERLVRFRSAQVIKSILADGISERIGALIVETRHGVRTQFMGASAQQDLATTLYSVRFPVTVETLAMGNAPDSEVAARFELLTNIIPQISIVAE